MTVAVGHDITERLPLAVSARTIATSYTKNGGFADVYIGGLPFLYAIRDENPYSRETADFKRQQIDTSPEPGEQTLSQWWVRDQDSWHRGSGINYYEPGTDQTTRYRFSSSLGVDVWNKGEATLLHRMENAKAGSTAYVAGARIGNQDVVFSNVDGVLSRHDVDLNATALTLPTAAGGQPVIAGGQILAGSNAGILAGPVTGSTLSVLWSTSSPRSPRPFWAKSRIIAAVGPSIHDLTLVGGNLDSHTPLWTHPSATWTWTGVAETPSAILASGYDSGHGAIFKFTVNDTGTGTPTLGPAISVADFPPGEEVHSICSYLGTFLGIGTTRGFRVAVLDNASNLNWGPLTIETTHPVRCVTARDSFFYVGVERDLDDNSGCARVNIAEEILNPFSQTNIGQSGSTLRYAWAYDGNVHASGQVDSITFLGLSERVVLGVFGSGMFVQSSSAYEVSGYVVSGKIRYATSEPKTFNLIKVRSRLPSGTSIAVDTIDSSGSEQFCFSLGGTFNTSNDITLKTIADNPQSHAAVRLTLSSDSAGTTGPTLESYQIKANPVVKVQRNIRLPLRLMDREMDPKGVPMGYAGSAWDRLQLLERMEEEQSVITFTDSTNGEAFAALVKSVQLVRTTPPEKNLKNFGGDLIVTLIKL